MSTANPEPRQSGEAEGSARQSSRLDQLKVPLVFTVEEAANRLWRRKNRHVLAGQFRRSRVGPDRSLASGPGRRFGDLPR